MPRHRKRPRTAPSSGLQTRGYTQLPHEIKLQILGYHTSYLRDDRFVWTGRCRQTRNGLAAFTHSQVDSSMGFHPTAKELAQLHFPKEALVFPQAWFDRFHGRNRGAIAVYQQDEQWEWVKCTFSANKRELRVIPKELLWLRYLALTAWRVQKIAATIQGYCKETTLTAEAYHSWLHFWRFVGPFDPDSSTDIAYRYRYLRAIGAAQTSNMRDVVEKVTTTFSTKAQYRYFIPEQFQFVTSAYISQRYLKSSHQGGISWKELITCGALKFDLLHYLLHLRPHQLALLFLPRTRVVRMAGFGAFDDWENSDLDHDRTSLVFDMDERGGELSLRSEQLDNADADFDWTLAWVWEGSALLSSKLPISTHRSLVAAGSLAVSKTFQRYAEAVRLPPTFGVDDLGGEELHVLFAREPA